MWDYIVSGGLVVATLTGARIMDVRAARRVRRVIREDRARLHAKFVANSEYGKDAVSAYPERPRRTTGKV